jgi:hypothetical protein
VRVFGAECGRSSSLHRNEKSGVKYLCIRKWDEHQHYKNRDPSWIKFHNRLLDDFDFLALSEVAQAQLLKLWLLASRTDNRIPYDLPFITAKITAKSAVDVEGLIVAGWLEIRDATELPARPVNARKVAARKKIDRERKAASRAEASASVSASTSASSLHLEKRREEERREELQTPNKKLAKYPHFTREMCDRLYTAWSALGRPPYSLFRATFGPLFPEQPQFTVEQVAAAIGAYIEDVKAEGSVKYASVQGFMSRFQYYIDLTTPIAKRDPARARTLGIIA